MKKWAKIMTFIGILYVVSILTFCTILYTLSPAPDYMSVGGQENYMESLSETVNASSPALSTFLIFLQLGIPAWIIFAIAAIWGREKEIIAQSSI